MGTTAVMSTWYADTTLLPRLLAAFHATVAMESKTHIEQRHGFQIDITSFTFTFIIAKYVRIIFTSDRAPSARKQHSSRDRSILHQYPLCFPSGLPTQYEAHTILH
jgi:hypothetical protein